DTSAVFNDVLIGEVWLASGQSNMEMPLTGYLPSEPIDSYQEEIDAANYDKIRMLTVQRNMSPFPVDSLNGSWLTCHPDTAATFSATAYFFARRLHKEFNVPVGIIHSSWGGTVAEAWTSEGGLTDFQQFQKVVQEYLENTSSAKEWLTQFGKKSIPGDLETFESQDFEDAQIAATEFDDSEWSKVTLPLEQVTTEVLLPASNQAQDLHGVFWFRKSFDLQEIPQNLVLYTGAIDDADVTYLNGVKIGSTWSWQEKREYPIRAGVLKQGKNVLSIRHFDGGYGSNLNGPIHLSNANKDTISLEGSWKGRLYADIFLGSLVTYELEKTEALSERPVVPSGSPNDLPSSLFNGMLKPIIPYTIKGAIWYQGESNVERAEEYKTLFPSMINDWRNQWGYEFPFYFVQIAPFDYGNDLSPALRDAQRYSLQTPKTGMAITMDIGNPENIHPGNKQDVGNRLALLALANDYGVNLLKSGPLYSAKTSYQNTLMLDFEYSGDGLVAGPKGLRDFEVAGEDGIWHEAEARIISGNVIVSSPSVPQPLHVRYGWKDYIEASLFNSEGLPASSFTSQD
ncbi:MAG: sialate O-acetylesterase, partial [Bacteroidia bacterium]|nr:sialate O-acetylesterase [Bacteroidia bacterium]